MSKTTTVAVKLYMETRARLTQLGEAKQRSSHWLMKQAIGRFLDVEERYEREKAEDQARWERYLETDEHVTGRDMKSRLEQMARQADEQAGTE